MIPTGVASVIAFIFFIVPGLRWQLLVERRRQAITESTFREASRVALISTPFSVVSIAIVVAAAHAIDGSWTRDLSDWAISGHANSSQAILVASCVALAELVLAFLLVGAAWGIVADEWYGTAQVVRKGTWELSLNTSSKNDAKIATVHLSGGRAYRGRVVAFSNDLAWQDRELMLESPLFSVAGDGTLTRLPDEYITIPASSIEAVSSLTVSATLAEQAASASSSVRQPPAGNDPEIGEID